MEKKRKVLGRGLGALLPSLDNGNTVSGSRTYFLCPIEKIQPNQYQPRKTFDDSKLEELVLSIKESGVIQPLIVRKNQKDGYELIAGERRWRASQKAGLKEVPVVIKDASDQESLEIAIVENIQRADLNPIEEAEGYKRLIEEFSYTQEILASRVGKDRATISNHLRVLKLPLEVKREIAAGNITLGHAKALLSLEKKGDLLDVQKDIIKKGLSVRETEALVKRIKRGDLPRKTEIRKGPDILRFEEKLMSLLGTKVRIIQKGKRGKIEIDYYSPDELERLAQEIGL